MDPVGKEEPNIEGGENAEKEKIKPGHLHFVLRKTRKSSFQQIAITNLQLHSEENMSKLVQKSPTVIRSFGEKSWVKKDSIVGKGRKISLWVYVIKIWLYISNLISFAIVKDWKGIMESFDVM